MSTKATYENFSEILNSTDKPILVDFYADWCPPCKAMNPILAELEEEGEVEVVKVNADVETELVSEHGVQALPTFVVFEGAKVKSAFTGSCDLNTLKSRINSAVSSS